MNSQTITSVSLPVFSVFFRYFFRQTNLSGTGFVNGQVPSMLPNQQHQSTGHNLQKITN